MAETHHAPLPGQTPHKPVQQKPQVNMFSNVLAIAAFIVLIVIVVWGLVHLARLSSPWFSSLFGGNKSALEVSAPAQAVSGQPIEVRWSHEREGAGVYAFLYQCVEGVRFELPVNGVFQKMPCGAAFAAGGATSSVVVLPILENASSTDVNISILFIPQDASGTEAQGSASITVNAASGAPQQPEPTTPKPVTPKPTTPSAPASTGPADLAVTVTSVSIDQYGNGTVTFNISNVGRSATGAYTFTAQLPTRQPYTYVSPIQSPLSPGSYIVNTLRFTQAIPGSIFVSVDPSNAVAEANESNNTASQFVTGTYPYNYQNPYPIY